MRNRVRANLAQTKGFRPMPPPRRAATLTGAAARPGVAGRRFIASRAVKIMAQKAAPDGAGAAHQQSIKTKNRREETACRDWNPLSLEAGALARRT
jgi:hypothetical protein